MSSNNIIFNTLLLLAVVTAQPQPQQQQQQQEESACSWSYYQQCGWQNTNGVRTATSDSFVTFGVTSSQPSDVYSATVNFFNSPYSPSSSSNNNEPRSDYEVISTGIQVYPTNINITKSNTFTYTSYGYYRLGYNVTFGAGSGYCTDKTFGVEGWIYFDESSCEFGVLTEEETTATATAATSTGATSLDVEGIVDAAPVPIVGESEGASGGNEETTTTTITTTDNTNNNNAAGVPAATPTPLPYNNPEGNNFFCGYSFDTVSSSCLQSKPCVNGVGVGVCGDTEGCFKVDMCVLEYEVAGRVIGDTATTTTTVATTMATTTTGATTTSSSTTSQPVSTTTATTTATTSASSSEAAIAPSSSSSSSTTSSTTSSAALANNTSSTSTVASNNNEEVLVEYDEEYPWPPSADEPSSSSSEEAATNSNNEMNFANSGDYSSADTLHCYYYFRVMMIMMIGFFGCVASSVS